MNKSLVAVLLLGVGLSASAAPIVLPDVTYKVEAVNPAAVGCRDGLGRQLQQDLDAAAPLVTVSANYDTERAYGLAKAQIVVDGQTVADEDLFPLGVRGEYGFGQWWHDKTITLNQHRYVLYGAAFETHGETPEEWSRNGIVTLRVLEPGDEGDKEGGASYACSISSAASNGAQQNVRK